MAPQARCGVRPGRRDGRATAKPQSQDEAAKLSEEIAAGAPARGYSPLTLAQGDGWAAARDFTELPLSTATLRGLQQHKYTTLTTIQRATLPHALAGRDILGAAKTGSGKTLCFIIPLVEVLFRARWTRLDGLGALVLTPTRELALQIFQELRKVGPHHEFSAGLLVGGKNLNEERASVGRMNILVATPGRLLQHMDETPTFNASSLQMLVLDEGDRLLDQGFAATLDAILASLPRARQTLLFSATQTKSVKDLARLSLSDPEYLAVHEAADSATPLKLQQAVAVVGAEHKMDVLWSFVKTHLTAKTIVFLSTCKQVRFFSEAFRKLRPGVPLRALHGGMKQMKRMGVFAEFCQAQHMVLFATDIAGRGLDFPHVDWVLQVDCPEDTAAYIHRVGRTARYMSAGRALLLVTPGEAPGMLAALAAAKVPVKPLKLNPAKQQAIGPALQALLSKNTQLKDWAQGALVAYARSVFLAPSKEVFDVASLPLEGLAMSWGLAAAPRMRFLKRVGGKQQVVAELGPAQQGQEPPPVGAQLHLQGQAEADDDGEEGVAGQGQGGQLPLGPLQGLVGAGQQRTAANGSLGGSDSDEGDELFAVKRRDVLGVGQGAQAGALGSDSDTALDQSGAPSVAKETRKKKKLRIKASGLSGQRVVFDEEGAPLDPLAALANDSQAWRGTQKAGGAELDPDTAGVYAVADAPEARYQMVSSVMKQRDQADKARLKEMKASLKAERKARKRAADAAEQSGVQLGRPGVGAASDNEQEGEEQGPGYSSSEEVGAELGTGSGSESEGVAEEGRQRMEMAHLGMQEGRKRLAGTGPAAPRDNGSSKRAKGARAATAAGMSIAEQEALVLARIRGTAASVR